MAGGNMIHVVVVKSDIKMFAGNCHFLLLLLLFVVVVVVVVVVKMKVHFDQRQLELRLVLMGLR